LKESLNQASLAFTQKKDKNLIGGLSTFYGEAEYILVSDATINDGIDRVECEHRPENTFHKQFSPCTILSKIITKESLNNQKST
jgi:hypothetical protein